MAETMDTARILAAAGHDTPVLITGPTASGKSALALRIAESAGGTIINADALQVFANWRILTARPTPGDAARAPHRLYGHVAGDAPYSVGHWLRDVAPLLSNARPIVVGGTGLYFSALTEGLAEIPPTPAVVRARGDALLRDHGIGAMLSALDAQTAGRIDRLNPARVQRAWEVQTTTGRGLAAWQDDTPPPLLPRSDALCVLVDPGRDALLARIEARFDAMLAGGVLDEARANLATWSPRHPSAKAIGAPELIAHLNGEITLDAARDRVIVATRQYAKRQRTWFRKRMAGWTRLALSH
ncbi:tRNA (adenosine(37)-N6)-dimethylallyltransferase MiaA [Oceaniglobus indicus]|uniref:tRNA (adenosine(37)-N6)-dimethylallyltransferase MiaA n=1 Tax=Oceaniglobus indicus TaxID=2047749 RepID=UPI001F4E600C|nr:tRNA (adenosine(37)-N6)-dimethylallyltransferase MiaA [Oceaniglobus indicus]